MTPQPKAASPKSFLDTSVVNKLQLGTSQIREYLSSAIPQKWYINNYVRMEYFRHSLIVWINLYFESAEAKHKTFGDAWKLYSEGFGREAKVAVSALTTMEADGFSFTKEEDKPFCRSKLQDFIYSMALQFGEMFTDMGGDPTHCARSIGKTKIQSVEIRRAAITATSTARSCCLPTISHQQAVIVEQRSEQRTRLSVPFQEKFG
jgi:hypothetical protein